MLTSAVGTELGGKVDHEEEEAVSRIFNNLQIMFRFWITFT